MARRDDDYGAVGLEEIVGLDELIGNYLEGYDDDDDEDDDDDDDDEEMDEVLDVLSGDQEIVGKGKKTKTKRKRMMALLRKIALTKQAGGAAIVRRRKNAKRRLLQGIGPVTIAASGSATITVPPQDLFKIKRVVVGSSIAQNFDFADIKVGQQSQFIAPGNVPAEAFTQDAVDCYVDFDTSNLGNLVSFIVNNLDTVNPQTFRAAAFGTAAVGR